ncbi:hypothetical protein BLOT_012699 [Blomia tropicalis]|nr:hypothetical protein BLOT_012699 [Blomia tropicalis]
MKYLSFITALILLATLFSFVFTQLNKDETKHEYGIAFPLEESESRLPPLSSVIQSELASASSSAKSPDSATTTTETVATSSVKSTADNGLKSSDSEGTFVPTSSSDGNVESFPTSETIDGSDSSSNSSEESEQTGANPKLIFIERLMGLNFQRSPNSGGGFSSFMEVRDTVNDDQSNNKPDNSSTPSSASPLNDMDNDNVPLKEQSNNGEAPWGNTLENLRSRWESRIRKFTFPFQNSYSVVLRASSVADQVDGSKDGSTDGSSDQSDSIDQLKPIVDSSSSSEHQHQPPPSSINKFIFQASTPIIQSQTSSSSMNPQTNQLLRMAALSMMSKLFSALRNQVDTNSKFDLGRLEPSNSQPELDLDDDDDDSNTIDEPNGERGTESAMPVPIIIAQRPRMIDPYGYGSNDNEQPTPSSSPIRSAVMYGRPAMGSPQSLVRSNAMSSMSPLGAIISAAIRQQQLMMNSPNGRRTIDSAPSQPQRLILLITHRPTGEPQPQQSSSRVQMLPRDEPISYHHHHHQLHHQQQQHQQQAQPMFHYAPLSAPSSPILYHLNSASSGHNPVIAVPQSNPIVRPQVVEVPVPMYMPMGMTMRMASQQPKTVLVSPNYRMMPQEMSQSIEGPTPPTPSPSPLSSNIGGGPVSIVYLHHADPSESSSPIEMGQPHPLVQQQLHVAPQESPIESDQGSSFVRIFLRPKIMSRSSMPVPIATKFVPSRAAYHRRIDVDSDVDDIASPSMSSSSSVSSSSALPSSVPIQLDQSRLRQWRDYTQFVRSVPTPHTPVGHLVIATRSSSSSSSNSDEPETAASSDDHHFYGQYGGQPSIHMIHHDGTEIEPQQSIGKSSIVHHPASHLLMGVNPHHQQHQIAFTSINQQHQQPQQQQQQSVGPRAAFFIVADQHHHNQHEVSNDE